MNWKDDLLKKAEELNLKKGGVIDVHFRSNSRNSSGRVGSIRVSGSNGAIETKSITSNQGGTDKMITVEGALTDLDKLIVEANDDSTKSILKGVKVLVKFLSTMRSNQLLTDEDKKAIKSSRVKKETEK
jgi:hypothetical protein